MGEQHTPEPWFEDEAGICAAGWGVVAIVQIPEDLQWPDTPDDLPQPVLAQLSANARLIAAAPRLLAELKNLRERFYKALIQTGTDPEFADCALETADAIIAKATGAV